MQTQTSIVTSTKLAVATGVLLIAGGGIALATLPLLKSSSGSSVIQVGKCTSAPNGVFITQKGSTAKPSLLPNGCRNAGNGMKQYTLTCLPPDLGLPLSTKYKVSWVSPCPGLATSTSPVATSTTALPDFLIKSVSFPTSLPNTDKFAGMAIPEGSVLFKVDYVNNGAAKNLYENNFILGFVFRKIDQTELFVPMKSLTSYGYGNGWEMINSKYLGINVSGGQSPGDAEVFYGSIDKSVIEQGAVKMVAYVDISAKIKESAEDNNKLAVDLPVSSGNQIKSDVVVSTTSTVEKATRSIALPDFSITNINFPKALPKDGMYTKLSVPEGDLLFLAEFQNNGGFNQNADAFHLGFIIQKEDGTEMPFNPGPMAAFGGSHESLGNNNQYVGIKFAGGFPTNGKQVVYGTIPKVLLEQGAAKLIAYVDMENTVKETVENNNKLSKNLPILAKPVAKPDLALYGTDQGMSTSDPKQFVLMATVINNSAGSVAKTPFYVDFRVNGIDGAYINLSASTTSGKVYESVKTSQLVNNNTTLRVKVDSITVDGKSTTTTMGYGNVTVFTIMLPVEYINNPDGTTKVSSFNVSIDSTGLVGESDESNNKVSFIKAK